MGVGTGKVAPTLTLLRHFGSSASLQSASFERSI